VIYGWGIRLADVVQILGPIFILIFIGYVSVSKGFLQQPDIAGLGKFVIRIALPATIFLGVANSDLSDLVQPWFFAIYGISSLTVYFLSLVVFRHILKDSLAGSSIKSLGSSFSNSGFIGLPLLLQFFDDPPMIAFAMIVLFENLVMMPLSLAVLEYSQRDKSKGSVKTFAAIGSQLIKSPLILAIIAGAFLVILGVPIPEIATNTISIASKATAGAGLIFIGGTIAGAELKQNYRDMILVAFFKLILLPTTVWIGIWLAPTLDSKLTISLILFSAAPMITVYPIIGSKFGFATFCSATLLLTTILSCISLMSLLLLI